MCRFIRPSPLTLSSRPLQEERFKQLRVPDSGARGIRRGQDFSTFDLMPGSPSYFSSGLFLFGREMKSYCDNNSFQSSVEQPLGWAALRPNWWVVWHLGLCSKSDTSHLVFPWPNQGMGQFDLKKIEE